MSSPTVALDYDGTLTEFCYPDHGAPQPHAAAVIKRLMAKGVEFTIHTCRIAPFDMNGERRAGVSVAKEVRGIDRKLKSMGLPYLEIHQLPWKPSASVYLDDNGMHHRGDWLDTEQRLLKRLREKGFDV
jgi:hypothetical protein